MPKITFSTEEIQEMTGCCATLDSKIRDLNSKETLSETYLHLQDIVQLFNKFELILSSHYDYTVKLLDLNEGKEGEECPKEEQTHNSLETGLSAQGA